MSDVLSSAPVLSFKTSSVCGSCSCGCVGVAMDETGVKVTNTTAPGGPVAHFTHEEWRAFVVGVKKGEFDI